MNRLVHSDKAPQALGPYSQALVAGEFVFTSGQVGIDPGTGCLAEGGVSAETRQALLNLTHVLEAAGATLDRVVKATVFLIDMGEFKEFNAAYAQFLGDHRPARSTVQVAALPAGARVEIEFVATRY
ncbi:MAG: RidA family protein [Candidatus Eisenbacteria bacterium]|jgi:2-iminobutanoate/2-iminopropanoate deaminase|nr:RidA family protein [Candidatus Eisenbacteria bacterium]